MNKITSIEDINALIAAGVEESTTLEYKSDINTTTIATLQYSLYILLSYNFSFFAEYIAQAPKVI